MEGVAMVAHARRKLLGGVRQALFHCWTRCVRRAFLCGLDRVTGIDYSHRRQWIIEREELLAGLFAIQIEFRAEMSNHLHAVLQTLPRVARRWSAQEVVRRWLTATIMAKCLTDEVPAPGPQRVEALARDATLVARLRRRLSSVSWFMGLLCENIARRANREDDCQGRFFESRYKCREITDLNALLVCGIYVDLNPYRAGEVDDPRGAPYTSVHLRMRASVLADEILDRPDGWMGELTEQPESLANEILAVTSRSGRRACDMGVLPISLADYVQLLLWTAAQLKSGQRDTIPADLSAILDRFHVQHDAWLAAVERFDTAFGHAVGRAETLAAVVARMEVKHMKGIAACRSAFT
jgi:hypothetical protein